METNKKETEKEFLEKVELFDNMTTRFLPMWLVEHKQRLISEVLYNELGKRGKIKMAFPGPDYKSPRKKEDLKTDKPIVGELETKKQKIFFEDMAKAINKYYLNGVGTVFFDDVRIFNSSKENWMKMEFYFKVEK